MVNKDWGDRWGDSAIPKDPWRNYDNKLQELRMSNKIYIQCTIDKNICFKLTNEILGKLKVKMLLGIASTVKVKGIRYRKASVKVGCVTGAYDFNGKQLKATYISNGVWKLKVN